MSKIIKNNEIHNAIEGIVIKREFRNYVGYSGIGHKCNRKLWYDLRHTYESTITPRVKRLLNRGKTEEVIIIADLRSAGVNVFNTQVEVVNKCFPQLKGHIDGMVSNVPGYNSKVEMLLEMKTANHARFEKIKKIGVKAFDSSYWMQIQGYMYELNLTKCLYIISNKNNDERLYNIYSFEPSFVTDIPYIIQDVLDNKTLPVQIGSSIWWECKFCDAYKICHGGDEIFKNCRNCSLGILTCDSEEGVICDLCSDNSDYDGTKCSKYKELEVLNV